MFVEFKTYYNRRVMFDLNKVVSFKEVQHIDLPERTMLSISLENNYVIEIDIPYSDFKFLMPGIR